MQQIFLVGGLPGSGKTTLAWHMHDFGRGEAEPIAADDFMINEDGDYEFDHTRLSEVHAKCQDKVRQAMENKCSRIFVHNTFTTMEERQAYHDLAKEHDYDVFDMVVLNTHKSKSDHNVPEASVSAMKERLVETIKTI